MTVKVAADFLTQTPEGALGAGQPLGHANGPIKFYLIGGWGGGERWVLLTRGLIGHHVGPRQVRHGYPVCREVHPPDRWARPTPWPSPDAHQRPDAPRRKEIPAVLGTRH
jgi:hypothetical protein